MPSGWQSLSAWRYRWDLNPLLPQEVPEDPRNSGYLDVGKTLLDQYGTPRLLSLCCHANRASLSMSTSNLRRRGGFGVGYIR
jgi:hypothetical protein